MAFCHRRATHVRRPAPPSIPLDRRRGREGPTRNHGRLYPSGSASRGARRHSGRRARTLGQAHLPRITGLASPIPNRRGWLAYLLVGEQIAAEGWPGLLAPSAARPVGKVLCLYRREHGFEGVVPKPPPSRVREPPPPPTGLVT